MTDWTTDQVLKDMVAIRKLKGVSNARLTGGYLVITTTHKLRHPKNKFLSLPKMVVEIPVAGFYPSFRYYKRTPVVNKYWGFRERLNVRSGIKVCLGDYGSEYIDSRARGPLLTVISLLGMLQTIQREARFDRKPDAADVVMAALAIAWVVFILIVVIKIIAN